MNEKYTFHLLSAVEPRAGLVLRGHFTTGEVKDYDVAPLLEKLAPFRRLRDEPGLFEKAHVPGQGYSVVWDDALDLSSEDLWCDGVPVLEEVARS